MDDLELLSVAEIGEKLRNLQEHLPGEEDTVYKLAAFLAGRFEKQGENLHPLGFHLAAELAIYDLQKGVDGYTGEPIRSSLVGYPPFLYPVLSTTVPRIAKAILPEAAANAVQEAYDATRG